MGHSFCPILWVHLVKGVYFYSINIIIGCQSIVVLVQLIACSVCSKNNNFLRVSINCYHDAIDFMTGLSKK